MVSSVSADDDLRMLDPKENFYDDFEIEIGEQIICTIEESIGFNWVDSKYVSRKYKLESYLFEKVEHRKLLKEPLNAGCYANLNKKKDLVADDFAFIYRCYSIKKERDDKAFVRLCDEAYGKNKKLTSVSCDNGEYVFHPEQLILVSPSEVSKNPKKFEKVKDSFNIEHGSCRVMKY